MKTENIDYGEGKRFQLVTRYLSHDEVIFDSKSNTNLFFIAGGGFGTPSTTTNLAKRIVDFLNDKHADEILYPEKP